VAHLDDLASDAVGEQAEFAAVLAQLGREYAALDPARPAVAGFVDFLQVSLRGDAPGDSRRDAVALLTFHSAKGLEFDTVFVTGAERGLVPISRASTPAQLAEERRLFYVALSRAARELHVTRAATRGPRATRRSPSPYLAAVSAVAQGGADAAVPPDQRRRELELVRRRLAPGPGDPATDALFDALATWRLGLARASQVPAYVIFSDATLRSVAEARPRTPAALLDIPGIGPVKLDRHGAALLEIVGAHAEPA
jgi:DNA helicase-2/ATP-dependent DNA helicase PcrA